MHLAFQKPLEINLPAFLRRCNCNINLIEHMIVNWCVKVCIVEFCSFANPARFTCNKRQRERERENEREVRLPPGWVIYIFLNSQLTDRTVT